MMLKEYINTTLQLTLAVFLFLSAFLVKPEFFNGIVTEIQQRLELAVACMAGYLIFFLPFRKSIRVTRVDTGIIILCLWYLLGEIINGFPPAVSNRSKKKRRQELLKWADTSTQ